ncbi:MAG TPA: cellulase family glycosylhydrolase, partial [Myxococcota bacterium]|nr:cellulase family glycosylhydrolase [Myxococcota bacterium]
MRARMLVPAALLAALAACADDPRPAAPLPPGRVRTELTYLKDAHDRTLFLHGINLGGSTKVPKTVDGRAIGPADMGLAHNTGVPSYVGRPWNLSGCAFLPGGAFDPASEPDCQAAREVRKLRDAGFNLFRFLINWEGIAPTAPDQYDRAYLATIAQNVAIANHYGVYMLLDMHQDAYSRHLVARYNEKPSYKDKDGNTVYPPRGTLENTLLALMPPYTDAVRGEGAPRWAVEACLFEKDLDAPTWGQPRLVSGLADANLSSLIDLITGFLGESEGPPVIPDWVETFLGGIAPASAPVTGTSDLLPFTIWGIMAMTSVDVVRNFACLLSGDFGDDGIGFVEASVGH